MLDHKRIYRNKKNKKKLIKKKDIEFVQSGENVLFRDCSNLWLNRMLVTGIVYQKGAVIIGTVVTFKIRITCFQQEIHRRLMYMYKEEIFLLPHYC